MSEWIPVIAALAGAAIGGIISYVATLAALAREDKSEKRAIILAKLEETHQVARSIRQSYKETYANMAAHLAVGTELQRDTHGPLEIDRLVMLTGFFFPELTPTIDILESARNKFGAILVEGVTAQVKAKRSNKEIFDDLSERYHDLDKACTQLLDAITLTARKRFKL